MAGASDYRDELNCIEDRMYGRAETSHQPQPERHLQPAYLSTDLSELENHTEVYQQQASNEILNQSNLLSHRTRPSELGHVDLARSRRHESFHDMAGTRTPFPAGHYSFQMYQYRPATSQDVRPVREDTPLSESLARRTAYPPTPILDRTSSYRSPVMEGQHNMYFTPTTRRQGIERSVSLSHRDQSFSYGPSVANLMPTPDKSTIDSPISSRLSPDSLRRELEATKEYSERLLTKLMETEQLLEDRGRMLAAALDDLARAQRQTEKYSQEYLRLRDSQNLTRQPAQPRVTSGQLEEAQKVTDFYRIKVDQLSKENMDISQQNRKLTEDLAMAQRKVP